MRETLIFAGVALLLNTPLLFAQNGAPASAWDYSLGSKEKFGKPMSDYTTPLEKIEKTGSSAYIFYDITAVDTGFPESPLGQDYYQYILPEAVFGLETIKIDIITPKVEKSLAVLTTEQLAGELEIALPIIVKNALKQKSEEAALAQEQKYLLRVKPQDQEAIPVSEAETPAATDSANRTSPAETEVDILVNVIFGQGVVVKIPPLKDPQEKERLMQALEKIAEILVRQEELLRVEEQSE